MKTIDEYRITSSNKVYVRARKKVLENTGKINCGYCPYNKGENSNHKTITNWKKYRKTQWKLEI